MFRFRFPLLLAVLALLTAATLAAEKTATSPVPPVRKYTLSPDKYERAKAYSHWQYALHFLGIVWTVGTLAAIIKYRVGPQLRDKAERASGIRFMQAAMFVPGLLLALDVPHLPVDLVGLWVSRHYDQSVQGLGSWLWDWSKGEFLELALAIFLVWILYGTIRNSPRRWWFLFWLASQPILVFLLFISPLVIEPLFFDFKPLGETQPALVDALQRVVERGNLSIPPDRMFEMNASEKTNSLNAYVAGFGASQRVVVWDTIIAKMTQPQIQFVFGHEMGHYVLNHIPKMIAIFSGLLLLGLMIGFYVANETVEDMGEDWGIRGIEDWASLPVLILIVVVGGFAAEPVVNAVSRYFEHQADVYGIEVTNGVIPPGRTGAEAFQILGEVDLAEPDPNPLIEFWFYSHPSISKRVEFVQRYDPWSRHETVYVH